QPRFDSGDSWSPAQLQHVHDVFSAVVAASRTISHPAEHAPALHLVRHRFPLASSTAGGKIVLSTGFLDRYAPDDHQLALIIGHEIAHAVCGHERQQLSAVWKRNAPQRLSAKDALEFLQSEPTVQLQIAPLVIAHERAADLLGLE